MKTTKREPITVGGEEYPVIGYMFNEPIIINGRTVGFEKFIEPVYENGRIIGFDVAEHN